MPDKWMKARVRAVYKSRWRLFLAVLKGKEPWRLIGGTKGAWKDGAEWTIRNGEEAELRNE